MTNADMRVAEVREFCELDESGQMLIKAAVSQLQLSARTYHRILKLSRTIADLAGEESIQSTHLVEALQYRPKGMMVWCNPNRLLMVRGFYLIFILASFSKD